MMINAQRVEKDSMGVNEDRVNELAQQNPFLATVLSPIIGYDKASVVIRKAMRDKKTVKQAVVELGFLSAEEAERILDATKMTQAG